MQQGAPEAFGHGGGAFARAGHLLTTASGMNPDEMEKRPPSDEKLINELGGDIDEYYGSREGRSDLQLLWNSASSLAHGEHWYSSLTRGADRKAVAEVLTARYTDAVCSALNVTHLHMLWLALARLGSVCCST